MSNSGWGDASAAEGVRGASGIMMLDGPLEVTAPAGDGRAMVAWAVPADPGTSTISDYVVVSDPPGGSCVSVSTACAVQNLTNGRPYTFSVRARSAAGEGEQSRPSNAVVPQPDGISITGKRVGRAVTISGAAVGLPPGARVSVWILLDDAEEFTTGAANVLVQPGGSFTWQRRLSPLKQLRVYFSADALISDVVTVAAKRSR